MGKFEIKTDKANKFRFVLKAGNGQVILQSMGYNTKSACENGIWSVKKHSQDDINFERSKARDGSPYFNLKASNGQIIGSSEMYSSESAMENGVASVKKNAPDAEVVEVISQWTTDTASVEDISFEYKEVPPPTVTIAYEEYEKLLRDSAVLDALEAAGVDNWDGYEEALSSI